MSSDIVRLRVAAEKKIAGEIVRIAMENCWAIGIKDEDGVVLPPCQFADKILAAMFGTDEDVLTLYVTDDHGRTKMRVGWIHLIYGNDGLDVVHDFSVNDSMEGLMDLVNAFIDREWPEVV